MPAPSNIQLKLTGDKELERTLARMPARMQTQVVKAGMRYCAKRPVKYIRQQTKKHDRECSVGRMELTKSIGSVLRTYRNTGITVLVVGPRKGFVNTETGTAAHRYAGNIEYGWQGQEPDPFMHRCLEHIRPHVINDFQAGIRRRIGQLVAKGKWS